MVLSLIARKQPLTHWIRGGLPHSLRWIMRVAFRAGETRRLADREIVYDGEERTKGAELSGFGV